MKYLEVGLIIHFYKPSWKIMNRPDSWTTVDTLLTSFSRSASSEIDLLSDSDDRKLRISHSSSVTITIIRIRSTSCSENIFYIKILKDQTRAFSDGQFFPLDVLVGGQGRQRTFVRTY